MADFDFEFSMAFSTVDMVQSSQWFQNAIPWTWLQTSTTRYTFYTLLRKFHGLKLAAKLQLIRQDIMEKEETTNGEYEVDLSRYFKLLSPDVDETIFEEE